MTSMSQRRPDDPPVAARGASPGQPQEQTQYLTFTLGGELFGVGILAVKEILEHTSLTPVPMMPDCIRGVMNLRGAVVPVMDLSTRFGRSPTQIHRRTCVVIVELVAHEERQEIGILVDAVNQVLEIPHAEIEPPPTFGAKLRPDFIRGLGKVSGKFVILLDVAHVLSVDEIGNLVTMAQDTPTTANENEAHV